MAEPTTDRTGAPRVDQLTHAVTDAVNDAILAADGSGVVFFANPAAQRLFGRAEDEIVGRPLTDLMPERFREAHRHGLARYLATGVAHLVGRASVELAALRADGSEVPIELSLGSWADEDGEQRFTGILRDLTERQEAQRHVRAQHAVTQVLAEAATTAEAEPRLLEALGNEMGWVVGGIWRPDDDAGVLRCTTTWSAPGTSLEAFERTSRATLLPFGEGVPGRALASGRSSWILDLDRELHFSRAPAAREAGLRAAVALPFAGEGGTVGVLEFFTRALREPDDATLAAMTALTDRIGQFFRRRQAEEALAAARAELERSNADLEQFAYVASHDLSEPLRTVSGLTQLLARRYEGRLDADADEFIGHIVGGVDRMQALIDGLLVFARAGNADVTPRPLDLGAIVRRVLDSLEAAVHDAGARVQVGELPAVLGDESQIARLVQNLLANALKFRGDRSPEIAISGSTEGGTAIVEVADRGIGISEADATRIFAMFTRLHGRDAYEGTGMGLAICQRIAEGHGGSISARPREGGGSVFEVRLPAAG